MRATVPIGLTLRYGRLVAWSIRPPRIEDTPMTHDPALRNSPRLPLRRPRGAAVPTALLVLALAAAPAWREAVAAAPSTPSARTPSAHAKAPAPVATAPSRVQPRPQPAVPPRLTTPPVPTPHQTAAARPQTAAARRPAPAAARPRSAIVDPAVTPAGGACQNCGPGGCRHGHAGHAHHRDCRDGHCAPYCPVRPATFGFYGTQWRRWPGQGVVTASAESAATPVKPPRSAVPGADEESREPAASDVPETEEAVPPRRAQPREPEAPAPDAPAPEPTTPEPTEPEMQEPEMQEPEMQEPPAAEPAVEKPAPQQPEPQPVPRGEEKPATPAEPKPDKPKPRPEDEDLFDDSAALHKVRRRIAIAVAPEPPDAPAASAVQPATHEGAGWTARRAPRPVPRVPFDPKAETERLNTTR
jgi:hypothetical protein